MARSAELARWITGRNRERARAANRRIRPIVTSSHRPRLRGPSSNYGGCPKDAERLLVGACPIVASYGGKDRSPLGYRAAGRLERALTTNGVEHDIKVYPQASHGFLNDHPPEDLTPLTVVLSRLSGSRYYEPSARDARRRTVAFFDRYLRS